MELFSLKVRWLSFLTLSTLILPACSLRREARDILARVYCIDRRMYIGSPSSSIFTAVAEAQLVYLTHWRATGLAGCVHEPGRKRGCKQSEREPWWNDSERDFLLRLEAERSIICDMVWKPRKQEQQLIQTVTFMSTMRGTNLRLCIFNDDSYSAHNHNHDDWAHYFSIWKSHQLYGLAMSLSHFKIMKNYSHEIINWHVSNWMWTFVYIQCKTYES